MPRERPWKLELEDIRAHSASPLSLVYIYSWIAGLGDCTNRRKKINSADQSWTLAFALSRRRGSLSTVAFARQPDTEMCGQSGIGRIHLYCRLRNDRVFPP